MYALATPHLALALPTLDGLGKIALFLVMLSILVVLHEFGHFIMARRAGVRVNDFAVGFGPTLLKWTSPRSGTNYRVNLLPIGGYCAMQGEDGTTSEAEQQRQFREELARENEPAPARAAGSVAVLDRPATLGEPILFSERKANAPKPVAASDNFQSKSPLARLSIVVAGPIANFILAFLILLVGSVAFGAASDSIGPQIAEITPNSPAMHAGFRVFDRIVAIDGETIRSGKQLVETIHHSTGKLLHITIVRSGQTQTIAVTPRLTPMPDGTKMGAIGFRPMPIFQRVPLAQAVPDAALDFVGTVKLQIGSYIALFSHLRENAGQLSGVIGMGAEAGTVQDLGWGPYFTLAANISIALGILNLLPFPALDGGRAVFIIAEMLRGKPVQAEKEALVHVTGFAVLMVLMVAIAYHDIFNLVTGKGVY
jgi:regulator of sigma E protease